MELLLIPVLLIFAYLVFIAVAVLLARLFFTKHADPELEFYKQNIRVRSVKRRGNIAKVTNG